MVELLLAHGADVNSAGPDGKTALMMAAMFNRTELVELLLARGANPQARDSRGLSVLDAARIMGAPDTAALLEQKLGQAQSPQAKARLRRALA